MDFISGFVLKSLERKFGRDWEKVVRAGIRKGEKVIVPLRDLLGKKYRCIFDEVEKRYDASKPHIHTILDAYYINAPSYVFDGIALVLDSPLRRFVVGVKPPKERIESCKKAFKVFLESVGREENNNEKND